jgi:hypothetical protein
MRMSLTHEATEKVTATTNAIRLLASGTSTITAVKAVLTVSTINQAPTNGGD